MVCGSFGQGAEGRLLACSQCGQCYHPFCVNVKVSMNAITFEMTLNMISVGLGSYMFTEGIPSRQDSAIRLLHMRSHTRWQQRPMLW